MTLTLRKLLQREIPLVAAHLLRLTPAERRMRFMGTLDDAAVIRHCDSLRGPRVLVVGAFEDGELRGVAEMLPDDPGTGQGGELAISVEERWQGRGIATRLLRRLLSMARNRGTGCVRISCYGDNHRMLRLAARFDARIAFRAGEAEVTIPLSPPDGWSAWDEAMDDALAWAGGWLEPSQYRQRPVQVRDQVGAVLDAR